MSSCDARAFASNHGGDSRTNRPRLLTIAGLAVCLAILAAGVVACGPSAAAPAAAPTAAAAPTIAPTPPPPPPTKPAVPTTAAAPAPQPTSAAAPAAVPVATHLMGADLFQMSCAPCHGADRQGSKFTHKDQSVSVPALAWSDLSKIYSTDPGRGTVEQQVALAITKGQDEGGDDLDEMMPVWSSLAHDQVDSLIAYLKTPAPATVPAPTLPSAASGLMGKQLFETSCFMCHGAEAGGNNFTRKGQTLPVPSLVWSKMGKTYATNPSRGTPEEQLAIAITKGIDQKGADLEKTMPRWSWLTKAQVESLVQYLKTLP